VHTPKPRVYHSMFNSSYVTMPMTEQRSNNWGSIVIYLLVNEVMTTIILYGFRNCSIHSDQWRHMRSVG